MKTSEFKKLVEELGFRMIDDAGEMVVYRDDNIVATVHGIRVNSLDNIWGEDVPTELFDVLVEYARTPIEERKSEKKYCLKLPFEVGNDGFYLNYNNNYGTYSFLSRLESSDWKTQFTQREIDALPSQDFIKTLIKEEEE